MPDPITLDNPALLEALDKTIVLYRQNATRDIDRKINGQEDRKSSGTLQDVAQAQNETIRLQRLREKAENKTVVEWVLEVLLNGIRSVGNSAMESDPELLAMEKEYTNAMGRKQNAFEKQHETLQRELNVD